MGARSTHRHAVFPQLTTLFAALALCAGAVVLLLSLSAPSAREDLHVTVMADGVDVVPTDDTLAPVESALTPPIDYVTHHQLLVDESPPFAVRDALHVLRTMAAEIRFLPHMQWTAAVERLMECGSVKEEEKKKKKVEEDKEERAMKKKKRQAGIDCWASAALNESSSHDYGVQLSLLARKRFDALAAAADDIGRLVESDSIAEVVFVLRDAATVLGWLRQVEESRPLALGIWRQRALGGLGRQLYAAQASSYRWRNSAAVEAHVHQDGGGGDDIRRKRLPLVFAMNSHGYAHRYWALGRRLGLWQEGQVRILHIDSHLDINSVEGSVAVTRAIEEVSG